MRHRIGAEFFCQADFLCGNGLRKTGRNRPEGQPSGPTAACIHNFRPNALHSCAQGRGLEPGGRVGKSGRRIVQDGWRPLANNQKFWGRAHQEGPMSGAEPFALDSSRAALA
jgi:hypothetical protein